MPALHRDWYFPAGRNRLYRRLGCVAMGALVAGGIVAAASLRLPPTNERQAPASHPVPHYRDCHAARAAGAAPLFRGELGYEPRLDADNAASPASRYHAVDHNPGKLRLLFQPSVDFLSQEAAECRKRRSGC